MTRGLSAHDPSHNDRRSSVGRRSMKDASSGLNNQANVHFDPAAKAYSTSDFGTAGLPLVGKGQLNSSQIPPDLPRSNKMLKTAYNRKQLAS